MTDIEKLCFKIVGKLPKGWSYYRNNALFKERSELCNSDEPMTNLLSVSEYYGVAKREDVINDEIISRADTLDGYRRCYKGDFVMNYMLAWKGAQATTDIDGVVSPSYAVFQPSNKIVPKFAHYLYRTSLFCSLFEANSTGIIKSRLRLYPKTFLKLYSIMPPVYEQLGIVKYLDAKCAAIDEAIERHKKIIEKLEEYQEATITKIVTSGLNNTEFKDSGYDVIGDIPCSWHVCRLRFLGTPTNGISKSGDSFGKGNPFVSYSDVYKNYSLPETVDGLLDTTEEERERYSVQEGDIFFTRTSETIDEVGLSSVCEKTIPNASFAGFLIRVRPITNTLKTSYAKYYFRSRHLRNYFAREMDITTRASLSQNFLKDVPVLLPSDQEQLEIAKYLDNLCSVVNRSVNTHNEIIAKLEEYKKSLIYNAVTGKIDCREENK